MNTEQIMSQRKFEKKMTQTGNRNLKKARTKGQRVKTEIISDLFPEERLCGCKKMKLLRSDF